MAFTPQQPGIYYNPPQPTQFIPRWFPAGPASPPVLSVTRWTAIAVAISLNPYPTWSAQVQSKDTANTRVQLTPPVQPAQPPVLSVTRWTAIGVEISLNPYPTWGAQRAPFNTYPPQAVTPPEAPNQFPISQWSGPTWKTQTAPQNTYPVQVALGLPLAPSQFPIPQWPQVVWNAQRGPLNAYPVQAVAPPRAPNQAPIGQWATPTWGTPALPNTPTIPPFMAWFPEPLDYSILGQWLAPTWATQTLPVLSYSGPPIPPNAMALPDFTGQHWYKASFLLVQANFNQTQPPIKMDIKNVAPPGWVIAQYPLAGTLVSPGTNITLTVIKENLEGLAFGIYPWYDPTKLQ